MITILIGVSTSILFYAVQNTSIYFDYTEKGDLTIKQLSILFFYIYGYSLNGQSVFQLLYWYNESFYLGKGKAANGEKKGIFKILTIMLVGLSATVIVLLVTLSTYVCELYFVWHRLALCFFFVSLVLTVIFFILIYKRILSILSQSNLTEEELKIKTDFFAQLFRPQILGGILAFLICIILLVTFPILSSSPGLLYFLKTFMAVSCTACVPVSKSFLDVIELNITSTSRRKTKTMTGSRLDNSVTNSANIASKSSRGSGSSSSSLSK